MKWCAPLFPDRAPAWLLRHCEERTRLHLFKVRYGFLEERELAAFVEKLRKEYLAEDVERLYAIEALERVGYTSQEAESIVDSWKD